MKARSIFNAGVGICLLFCAVACQKDVPSAINDNILTENSNSHLKSAPNTANLDQLLFIIAEKVQNGEISKGNGNALTAKINSAKNNIQKGQLKAAENVLDAFINQVNTFVADGILSTDSGQLLTTIAIEGFHPKKWKCGDNFTDARDGHIYKSISIGNQCWMAENLAYLPAVYPSALGSLTQKYYYVYGYEGTEINEAKTTSEFMIYGVLYSGLAAIDACASGWHLPTDAEWQTMEIMLGMSELDANRMGLRNSDEVYNILKESGTLHWMSPNSGSTNASGFTALPGGMRRSNPDTFEGIGEFAAFWTSTEYELYTPYFRNLASLPLGITRTATSNDRGFSVRCIKD